MSAEKAETPLCEQFGFDAEWRQAQLLLVGLDACPDDQVRQLHEQVLAHEVVEQVVDRFFAQLMRHAQAAELLSSFDLDHLKERQVAYFDVFGVNCRSAEYFESRALMGIAHARVGVPLSLYLSAFGLLQGLLLDAIVERLSDEAVTTTRKNARFQAGKQSIGITICCNQNLFGLKFAFDRVKSETSW